jgi:ABC-2 type transport system permease protein
LFAGYAGLALVVAIAMQALTATGFWLVANTTMDDPVQLGFLFQVAFSQLPALVALGGLALALVGWAKQATGLAWAYLVASFLVVYIGGMLDLPRWADWLTPFGFLSRWPAEPFSWGRWAGLALAGLVLGLLGALGYRRRDIIA